MKATNQGFVDLHTPAGFMLIGFCFLFATVLIIVGAITCRVLAQKDREYRAALVERLVAEKNER